MKPKTRINKYAIKFSAVLVDYCHINYYTTCAIECDKDPSPTQILEVIQDFCISDFKKETQIDLEKNQLNVQMISLLDSHPS